MKPQPIRTSQIQVLRTGRTYGAWPLLAETADGQLVVLSSSNGGDRCSRWDPETGREVWSIEFYAGGVRGKAVTCPPGGGAVLASANEDGVERLDALTGEELSSPYMEEVGTVWDVAAGLLPGGRRFFVGAGHDGRVFRWDAMSGDPLGAPLTGHRGCVMAVTAVPGRDGTAVFASGDENGVILRWNPETGERIGNPLTGSCTAISQITSLILPTGSTLLIGTDSDSTLWRWDASTGESVGEPISLGSEDPKVAPAVVDGAARLFTSGADDMVREWDAATGELVGIPWTGIDIEALARADGSTVFATGSPDGDISLYK
ncbi:WD40 repeat domain-containing protein [Streptomyces albiflavescens]|uniref:WD40 repeat domain-containing protein n=1 Tax=Streptomyces albiflavescens TaxID=1623582 RepID=UPI0016641062|nr:WD40 repeat domain-containing protein [Streptomyces albiflavescens]